MPVVSIIVPVYNRPKLLERALISVEKQIFADWECIVVDDGSTDNTAEVALKFVKKDPRFRVIRNPHAGGNKAVNDGLLEASGTYITLLGSDDEFTPDHLKLRVTEMEKNHNIDVLHGGFRVIGDEMVPDKRSPKEKISLYHPAVYVGGTVFGKKDIFKKLNGFRKIPYASASDFVERAIALFQVKRVAWPTYIYHRDHDDSASDRYHRKHTESIRK